MTMALTGLKVSASTVQRTTESVGEDVARRRAAGETFDAPAPRVTSEQVSNDKASKNSFRDRAVPASPAVDDRSAAAWEWNVDAAGQRVAYTGLDATGVPQQGPQGEKTECRMPWVGLVFNPQPAGEKRRRRIWDTRYVAGLMSLEEIGRQLRAECRAVNVSGADVVIGLTDGGNGLENCLISALGGIAKEIVFILDFYHASEHLLEFAKVLHRDDEARQRQTKAWCHTLKHEGGESLLRELEAQDMDDASPQTAEAFRLLLGYVRNNRHRMDYPKYISKGWQIGSGMVEAACKTVVCQRLKESGMRWREPGTTALSQLRALYKSEPKLWKNYWNRTVCP
ncbi:MAG: hypothetical protein IH897_15735 [Planctomycetes bacterium]|nr:hypothetical protein [Planctomycetota bacterium]